MMMVSKHLLALCFVGWIAASGGSALAGEPLSLSQLASATSATKSAEFGSRAVPADAPYSMEKWQGVLEGLKADMVRLRACLESSEHCPTILYRDWQRMMRAAAANPDRQLELVNRFFNAWRHHPDGENGTPADSWSTPTVFFEKSGDCEDYAIAKYASLLLLGISPERMRIVAVENRRSGLGHAVLSVATNSGFEILDSLQREVMPDSALSYYRPVFSVGAKGGWMHVPSKRNEEQLEAQEKSFAPERLIAFLTLDLGGNR